MMKWMNECYSFVGGCSAEKLETGPIPDVSLITSDSLFPSPTPLPTGARTKYNFGLGCGRWRTPNKWAIARVPSGPAHFASKSFSFCFALSLSFAVHPCLFYILNFNLSLLFVYHILYYDLNFCQYYLYLHPLS